MSLHISSLSAQWQIPGWLQGEIIIAHAYAGPGDHSSTGKLTTFLLHHWPLLVVLLLYLKLPVLYWLDMENKQPCLVHEFSGIVLIFSPFNLMSAIGLLYIALTTFRYVSCISGPLLYLYAQRLSTTHHVLMSPLRYSLFLVLYFFNLQHLSLGCSFKDSV